MKRILITGANGFVGSNIIDELVSRGWMVYAADRQFDNPAVAAWPSDQVTLIQGDVEALPALAVDALIHGAAITADAEQRGETPEANFLANLMPAIAMMQYAHLHAIPRTIFMSSSAVYRVSARGLLHEENLASPLGMYAIAKHTIEALTETLRQQYQRDVICIRLGNLYGPHEVTRETRPNVSLIQQWLAQALTGTLHINTTLNAREWTYVRDVGAALDALLQAPSLPHALYQVAAGVVHPPEAIAQVIQAALGEQNVTVTFGADAIPDTLTRLGTLDASRLTRDTGFNQWTSLEDGIRQTLDVMRQEADHA